MLLEYVQAAMQRARYKLLDDGTYFGETPRCRGVWANESSLERCREVLREVLEEWLVLKLKRGESLQPFGRHRITILMNRGRRAAGETPLGGPTSEPVSAALDVPHH